MATLANLLQSIGSHQRLQPSCRWSNRVSDNDPSAYVPLAKRSSPCLPLPRLTLCCHCLYCARNFGRVPEVIVPDWLQFGIELID